jgi:hypothetical protein
MELVVTFVDRDALRASWSHNLNTRNVDQLGEFDYENKLEH